MTNPPYFHSAYSPDHFALVHVDSHPDNLIIGLETGPPFVVDDLEVLVVSEPDLRIAPAEEYRVLAMGIGALADTDNP